MDPTDRAILRRYTNLAAAIHLLLNRQITLLSPSRWDDRNDAYCLELYQERKKVGSTLGICFAETEETYHHWRVFSHGGDGVSLEFDKEKLIDLLSVQGVKLGKVEYFTVNDLKARSWKLDQLPFIKRYPYRDEEEFRGIFDDPEKDVIARDFVIDLECVKRINISPWMPKPLSDSVKQMLRELFAKHAIAPIPLNQSQLVNLAAWKNVALRKLSDQA